MFDENQENQTKIELEIKPDFLNIGKNRVLACYVRYYLFCFVFSFNFILSKYRVSTVYSNNNNFTLSSLIYSNILFEFYRLYYILYC